MKSEDKRKGTQFSHNAGFETVQDPVLIFAQRYQAFFNSTTDGIVVFNPQGDILDANPRMISMSGFPYEILVSKTFQDLFPPDSARKINRRFQNLLNQKQSKILLDGMLITRSGKENPVEIGLSLLEHQYGYPKTFLVVIRDVAKRKEAEKHLVHRAEELQKVFDAVPTILLVMDEKMTIQKMNRSGLKIIRRQGNEGHNYRIGDFLECVHNRDSAKGCGFGTVCDKCCFHESLRVCLHESKTLLGIEETLQKRSCKDTLFYFRINVVPLEMEGKRQAVVSLEDITARKKAELEAIQLNESIARTNMELKKILDDLARSQSQLIESQKLEQIGLLASGFAHNLKTPISGIKGYAQLLKMEQKDSKELDMIIEEVEVLESIINNLMLKSRKEHENRNEYLNLNQLIHVELEFLKANLFFKHQVKTEMNLDEGIPSIYGVYAHFSQSIMNIVQNALDAMYDKEEKILTIQTRHDDQFITIEIGDTGCGIPREIRESVFDVFFTTKPTSVDRKGEEPFGTGLGLSNANYFIHHYGGTIEISDRKPRGTLFTLRVPYRQEEKSNYVNKILIVDDSKSIVDVLMQICQDMGMEAYGATNAEQALKLYGDIGPRIIVSDLSFPGMTGKEMMEIIRDDNPRQKVVYITGYFDNPEFKEWLTEESKYPSQCAVMRKPFPLDNFKKVLQKMVRE